MKQVTAIIRPNMVERVEHALQAMGHFPGFTMISVKGESRGRAPGHAYAPTEWDLEEHDNVMIFVMCGDDVAPRLVDAIRKAAHTGRPGDGVIAVSELSDVVRIRTDERGDCAL